CARSKVDDYGHFFTGDICFDFW
nr:immunoglobulin heavy chain junction region [Macaca mulatta]MOY21010.1 immunoglobulin heavy chain junction region [Macaca mulatta]